MVAASILPVTFYKGQVYFLFGKENELEDSAKGFSDFGGGLEKGEQIMDTALREGAEELCGFLGDASQLKKLIKKNGGVFRIVHNDYNVHMFYLDYDPELPVKFTNNHKFLWNRMDKHVLNDSKLFEKQEIRWFSAGELKKKLRVFRGFYREIVKEFINKMSDIKQFVIDKQKRKSGTSDARRGASEARRGASEARRGASDARRGASEARRGGARKTRKTKGGA